MLKDSKDLEVASKVLETLPIGVFSLDETNAIIFVNQMGETLLGRSVALLLGRSFDEVFERESDLAHMILESRRLGGTVTARGLRMTGANIAAPSVDASAAYSTDGKVLTVSLAPIRGPGEADPTGETATMAEVARILGHEVKNPLAGMVGAAQLLSRKARDDQQDLLTLIRDEGARITRIVDRFSAFETFFRPRPATINIHQVLKQVVDLAKASFAADIEVRDLYDVSLPDITADPDHLHEAFLNIVKNACEAMTEAGVENGVLTLNTRFRAGVRLADTKRGGRGAGAIEVSIADNGPGVPKEAADRLFAPFFTTKTTGAGIGLSVVAEIMTAHGGYVDVETTSNGACFRLILPIDSKVRPT